jgi:hypothetical protein
MLDGLVPIDPQTAAELAALAPSFTRILTHPITGNVIGIDAKKYRPPADYQNFVKHRDATCRFPGCQRAAETCDIDHVEEYAQGGATNVANLASLCRSHHMLKSLGAFDLENAVAAAKSGNTTSTLVWTDPFGREYRTVPEPTVNAVPVTANHPLATIYDQPPPF